jgi:ribose-phosphate pyrophosphokinase
MLVPGSASQGLTAALAAETGREIAAVDYHRFPDGERKVEVSDPGESAVVVASTASDRAHVELLQLQDAVHEAGVEDVTTVIPYMGYARQDRAFEPGEPVSARAMARAFSTGTDRVLTVDPHEPAVCDYFDVPATGVSGAGQLADGLPADLDDPLFLSPDEGGIAVATAVRDAYGDGEVDYFEKTRLSGDAVEIEPSDATVEKRDVVVADDIVATGSTMSEAIAVLSERDAAGISVACVHGLFVGNARTKLARAGVDRIVATDTIEGPASEVSVAPAIAAAL